jgi:hypothetical protein
MKNIVAFLLLFNLAFSLKAEDSNIMVVYKSASLDDYIVVKAVSYPIYIDLDTYTFAAHEEWDELKRVLSDVVRKKGPRGARGNRGDIEIILEPDRADIKDQYKELTKAGYHKFTITSLILKKAQKAYLAKGGDAKAPEKEEIADAKVEGKPKPTKTNARPYWDIYD